MVWGGGGGKSLSPELAEKYFNYFEVVFADTIASPGTLNDGALYYRAAGFTNQSVKLAVPEGLYDNTGSHNYAIMMAGVRNLNSGECTLLATGVIAAHEGGSGGAAAQIGPDTTRVIFKLTALTAQIKAAADSAFVVNPLNYGTTSIDGKEHPFFGINTIDTNGGTTTAELTLSGWGGEPEENQTKEFIYLVHDNTQTFNLAGIGTKTGDGDEPLDSTANITWQITNTPNARMQADEAIGITFTSKSTAAFSGMGWLPVRVPVKAFADVSGGQVWQAGSGILRNQLDAGAGTEGAGIVILHGNKMSKPGVGAQQDWVWEYVLDLANAAPKDVPGMWDYTAPNGSVPGIYMLKGHKAKTLVRVINSTNNHRIAVAPGAKVTVLLDDMSIDLDHSSYGLSPFGLETGSACTLYLRDGTTNILTANSSNDGAGLRAPGTTNLIIKGSDTGKLMATGGLLGAGIGGMGSENGGDITIEGGHIIAGTHYNAGGTGAGIGGGADSDGGNITISGGIVEATGNLGRTGMGSAGIGGGAGGDGGNITISGGMVTAQGGSAYVASTGAGIGGGSMGATGNITISGGVVYARGGGGDPSNQMTGAGIGSGSGGDGGTITISGGIVTAIGGEAISGCVAGAGIGGSAANYTGDEITITGGVIEATGGSSTGGSAGAGIGGGGSGFVGTIKIYGGTVVAARGTGGAPNDIGIGDSGSGGSVAIYGGSVNAANGAVTPAPNSGNVYMVKLTLDGLTGGPHRLTAGTIGSASGNLQQSDGVTPLSGYGLYDVQTEAAGSPFVYFWLPQTTTAVELTANRTRYGNSALTLAANNTNAETLAAISP